MDSPEERLPGTTDVMTTPASPQGSAGSRGSSNSRTSLRSGRSQQQLQQGQQQQKPRNGGLRRYCSTVVACLAVGVVITLGSVAMTVIGYFAVSIATRTVIATTGNATTTTSTSMATTTVLDEELRENLFKFRTFGPVMIGFGSFLIMCACVLLCEERDKRKRSRDGQAGQTLLGEHERIMQEARQRFYNENRTALLAEAQGATQRPSRANSADEAPPATMTVESDHTDVGGAVPASPVVLVHGPVVIAPPTGRIGELVSPSEAVSESQSGDGERQDGASTSQDGSPDRQPASPTRILRTSNTVAPVTVTDGSDIAGTVPAIAGTVPALPLPQPVVSSPVLPRIGASAQDPSSRSTGGAVPKSILVPAGKLSPIRSHCGGENGPGPMRVRLVDDPAEMTPVGVSGPCRSAECLPQTRSPGRLKRGRRKKGSSGSGRLDPRCRCVSDPAMASRSPDVCCCCLQTECCASLDGSCQLNAPSTAPNTPTGTSLVPTVPAVGSESTSNNQVGQPLTVAEATPEQSVEPTHTGVSIDDGNQPRQQRTAQDKDPPPTAQNQGQREPVIDAGVPPLGVPTPTQQADVVKAKALLPRAAGGAGDEAASDLLVSRDRNSNVTLSSRPLEASPGKGAPIGETKSGITVLNLSS